MEPLIIFLIFGVLIIIYILCNYLYTIETFTTKDTIVLVGDSIFDNGKYTGEGNSVKSILQKKHYNIMNKAVDGSTMINIRGQFATIPEEVTNNKQSAIFLSVGGNDIIKEYTEKDESVQDMRIINRLIGEYYRLVKQIVKQKDYKCKLILTSIYYPTEPNFHKYYPIIQKWNKKQSELADKLNLYVFSIDSILKKNEDFINDIEPSNIGSKKIAKEIHRLVKL
jgi:lysophospholipase L1-like esterase